MHPTCRCVLRLYYWCGGFQRVGEISLLRKTVRKQGITHCNLSYALYVQVDIDTNRSVLESEVLSVITLQAKKVLLP